MSAEAATLPRHATDLKSRHYQAQVFRFAFGLTLACGVAFGIGWPLSFLTPVLAAKFLTSPRALSPKQAAGVLVLLGACLLFSTQFLLPTLAYPAVHLLLTGLLLFWLFYWKAGGGQPVVIVLLLIFILVVPLIGTVDPELAGAVAIGIYLCAIASISVTYLASAIFPDPSDLPPKTREDTSSSVEVPSAVRAQLALRSLVVLFPLAAAFLLFSLTGAIVALIMAALLSLETEYGKHLAAGKGLVMANTVGGLVAVALYQLLVFVPALAFFLLLVLLSGLWIGAQIFSGSMLGKLLGAGITTVFIVLGPTLTGSGEAGESLVLRLVLILLSVLYVVLAFGFLERLTRGKRRSTT